MTVSNEECRAEQAKIEKAYDKGMYTEENRKHLLIALLLRLLEIAAPR